jgi:hypothetical protein
MRVTELLVKDDNPRVSLNPAQASPFSDFQDSKEHVVRYCPYILLRGTIHGE